MRPLIILFTLMFSLFSSYLALAKALYQPAAELQAEAESGFGEILDLWRDGRYAELYDRTLAGGRGGKEQFAKRLAAASKKPACCWEKMQEVKVSVKNDYTVSLRAKVGLEGDRPALTILLSPSSCKKKTVSGASPKPISYPWQEPEKKAVMAGNAVTSGGIGAWGSAFIRIPTAG